jgi:hypothetical protein
VHVSVLGISPQYERSEERQQGAGKSECVTGRGNE